MSSAAPATAAATSSVKASTADVKLSSATPAPAPTATAATASVAVAAPSSSAAAPLASIPSADVTLRASGSRGHSDHAWLNTYHTFSFGGYRDGKFDSFHSLRVINEDRVIGGEGFPSHGHSNYEIFSYVVSGALSHRDSMGNHEIISPGQVQYTSAGAGMMHSEFNASETAPVHFIQIWIKPDKNALNLPPSYQTRSFPDALRRGKWCCIVAPRDGFGSAVPSAGVGPSPAPAAAASADAKPAVAYADVRVYASVLAPGEELSYVVAAGRDAYVHVIQDSTGYDTEANLTALTLNGTALAGGDGAFLTAPKARANEAARLHLVGAGKNKAPVEFLLFDLKKL